ncbi:ferredoxin [Candidatus Parcubacteria bacterium]|nr:MAG: ferredoxin [Candidatus Parcubacteria bacterium]
MSIKVNQETCIGCGSCAAICPSNFEMNAEGKSEATSQETNPCVSEAANICPVQAITVS